jgi:hypothetical protein
VDTVKNLVGLQAVSQVWETTPAWYVWMTNAQGVYKLQLTHAEQLDDRGRLKGIFTVKCFPYPQRSVFKTFSPEERALRNSPLFDDTDTPTFEHLDQLPEDAFNVAVIECDMHTDRESARFTLESLSMLRTVVEPSPDAGPQVQRRCVPGWQLGRPFFNWLLSAYAFESRTMPTRIRLCRSPGFETVQATGLKVAYRDSLDIHCYTACVDFGSAAAPPDLDQDLSEQGDMLLDCTFPDHAKPHDELFQKVSDLFSVDDLWWSLAVADYPSHLGSTCGCCDHHDHDHQCTRPVLLPGQKPFSS